MDSMLEFWLAPIQGAFNPIAIQVIAVITMLCAWLSMNMDPPEH